MIRIATPLIVLIFQTVSAVNLNISYYHKHPVENQINAQPLSTASSREVKIFQQEFGSWEEPTVKLVSSDSHAAVDLSTGFKSERLGEEEPLFLRQEPDFFTSD